MQMYYFVSESQRNLRRAVCVSPPFFMKAHFIPTEYALFERNCAICGNDGSCSSVVQCSHESDSSDSNLPSFLLVNHERIA